MSEIEQTAHCAHCGAELSPSHVGPCPSCGKEGKNINVSIKETIKITSSLHWETRREYYQKHKGATAAVIAITVISPFIGLALVGPLGIIVGLALGSIAYYLGPKAATKIIEITKGNA
jgi:predicted RNA-binding Zn-ribbon protein involved in translation (DUF1610 family)